MEEEERMRLLGEMDRIFKSGQKGGEVSMSVDRLFFAKGERNFDKKLKDAGKTLHELKTKAKDGGWTPEMDELLTAQVKYSVSRAKEWMEDSKR